MPMRQLIGGRLLIASTIQKSSPRTIGPMQFFSELSALLFPRGLSRSTYFTPTKGTGNKNTVDERRTIVVNDNAVVVTGFYTLYSDGRWQTSSGPIAIHYACHEARR